MGRWYEIENFNWVWLDLCGDRIDWVERSRLAALRPHRHTGARRVNGRALGIIKISSFDHRPHWRHHYNQRSSVISHILTSRFWKDNPQICHPTKHLTSQCISMVSMSVSKWMLRVEMFWQPGYRTSITLTRGENEEVGQILILTSMAKKLISMVNIWLESFCRLLTMLSALLNVPQIGLFTMSEGGLTCSYLQINLSKHNQQYQQSSRQY